jgi:hypothetical protein
LKYVRKLRLRQIMAFISFYFSLLAKLLVAVCNGIGEYTTQCMQICINRSQKQKKKKQGCTKVHSSAVVYFMLSVLWDVV